MPSVGDMTTNAARLVYDELSSPLQMHDDCAAVARSFPLVATAPSLRYADFPQDVAKPEITITEAARRIADALQLHLD